MTPRAPAETVNQRKNQVLEARMDVWRCLAPRCFASGRALNAESAFTSHWVAVHGG